MGSAKLGLFLGYKKLCRGDFRGGIYRILALPKIVILSGLSTLRKQIKAIQHQRAGFCLLRAAFVHNAKR